MSLLKKKIQNRHRLKYLSKEAETEKAKLSVEQQTKIESEIVIFYETIIEYIELWEKSFDGSSCFRWMSLNRFPDWVDIQSSYEYAVERYGEKLRGIINRDQLLDEFAFMKPFCEENINNWMDKNVPCEVIWTQIFQEFRIQSIRLVHMEKLVQFSFCLPGTSTEVERLFSLIFNILGRREGPDEHENLEFFPKYSKQFQINLLVILQCNQK